MSAAAAWGAAGTALASYFGYQSQRKYLAWLKKFYAPELEAKKSALPALKNMVLGYYLPQVGKQSELLKAQHMMNLEGIGREEARSLRSAQRDASLHGGPSLGVNNLIRLGLLADRTRNAENLGYAQAQEQYLSSKGAEAMGGLQTLATLGQGANPYALQMTQSGMEAAKGFWSDMGSMLNQAFSYWATPKQKPTDTTTTNDKKLYQGDVNPRYG